MARLEIINTGDAPRFFWGDESSPHTIPARGSKVHELSEAQAGNLHPDLMARPAPQEAPAEDSPRTELAPGEELTGDPADTSAPLPEIASSGAAPAFAGADPAAMAATPAVSEAAPAAGAADPAYGSERPEEPATAADLNLDALDDEQLRALIEARTGKKPHHNTGRSRLIETAREAVSGG